MTQNNTYTGHICRAVYKGVFCDIIGLMKKATIIENIYDIVKKYPDKMALGFRKGHHFGRLSFIQLWGYSQTLALSLRAKGLRSGDRLVIVSENRPEWVITDFAAMILGVIVVPVHDVMSAGQIGAIINEVEPKAVFVDNNIGLDKLFQISNKKPHDYYVYCFDDIRSETDVLNFKDEVYKKHTNKKIEIAAQGADDITTIIYTSGTTGDLKGVELSSCNFLSNISGVLSGVHVSETDKFLSVLPVSHIFERTVGYYLPLLQGASISYVGDPINLASVAEKVKPTIIIGVPRLFEKVYKKVCEKASKNAITKIIFKIGIDVGKSKLKSTFLYKIFDKLLYGKIKSAFGGDIRFFVSGAASLPTEIGEFFDALNIPVLEGYGLTETSPIVSNNTIPEHRYGTVGKILSNIEYKIVKDELLLKGPSIFKGYYKNPIRTAEAFTSDGWFKTGDLVAISDDGYLTFKAREKEIIALSTGKKIAPTMIEAKLESSPLISQAFVFGDNKKCIAALIVPEKEMVQDIDDKRLKELLQKDIDVCLNQHVARYEQIRLFVIIREYFTVENGLLTISLKIRRNEIANKYREEIESIY